MAYDYLWVRKRAKWRSVDVHVSDHCNLNCKGCSHYSNISEPYCLSVEELEKELSAISPKVLNYFKQLRLMGGEPLLNKDICALIAVARKYFQGTLAIITNGLLVKTMPDDFFAVCKANDVEIWLSEYPINLDYERLSVYIENKGVKSKIFFTRDKFTKYVMDLQGNEDGERNYHDCHVNHCMQLRGGKLYTCAHMAYADKLEKRYGIRFERNDDDVLVLSEVKNPVLIHRWLATPKSFCRYCALSRWHDVDWGRSEGKIDEWC